MTGFKNLLRRLIPPPVRRMRGRLAYLRLLETNLFIAPPAEARQLFLRSAQQQLRYPTFIETGTYAGDTTATAIPLFDTVHTIELDPDLARRARHRFAGDARVTVHQGDSGQILEALLPQVRTSAIFWLDAHYSGGVTARGDADTPILRELSLIGRYARRPMAVFIDDVRMFGTDPAYPTLEEVIAGLRAIDSQFHIGVVADMLWATPKRVLEFHWTETRDGTVEIPQMEL